MAAPTRTRLKGLAIKETSGVDHPANGPQVGGEGWLVMKADGSPLSTEEADAIRARAAKSAKPKEPTVADEKTPLAKALEEAELPESLADVLKTAMDETVEAATSELKTELDEAKKALDSKIDAPAPVELTDLEKALGDDTIPDSVKAVLKAQAADVEKARKDAEEATKAAEIEKGARIEAGFVAKAEGFDGLPIEAKKLGPILRKAAEAMDTDEYAEFERVLTSANEIGKANAAALLTTVGKDGSPEPSSALGEIHKAASELQKSDPSLTVEMARDRIYQTRPDLVSALDKERA